MPVVSLRPLPPAWASTLPHRVRIVESDQPGTIRRVQRRRIAEAVRPLRRRLGSQVLLLAVLLELAEEDVSV